VRSVARALVVLLLIAWVILFATGRYVAAILVAAAASLIWHGSRRLASRFARPS
jgi:ABC-type molybdate transport system substrate-binding protein